MNSSMPAVYPSSFRTGGLKTGFLAHILIRAEGFGFGRDPWVPEINREAWNLLGFSMNDLEEVVFKMGEELFHVDGLDWHDDRQV